MVVGVVKAGRYSIPMGYIITVWSIDSGMGGLEV